MNKTFEEDEIHMDFHPKPNELRKDLTADEFYRLEYIERLKTLNDIDDWED